MIIELERVYKNSGWVSNVMVNTNYIVTIETVQDEPELVRVVMRDKEGQSHIFYVTNKYEAIRKMITPKLDKPKKK